MSELKPHIPANPKPWTQRMFEVKPVLDEDGKPMREPGINREGFWQKPVNPIVKALKEDLSGKRKKTRRK